MIMVFGGVDYSERVECSFRPSLRVRVRRGRGFPRTKIRSTYDRLGRVPDVCGPWQEDPAWVGHEGVTRVSLLLPTVSEPPFRWGFGLK